MLGLGEISQSAILGGGAVLYDGEAVRVLIGFRGHYDHQQFCQVAATVVV